MCILGSALATRIYVMTRLITIVNGAATFQPTPRSIKNLEKGIEILETQYEKCEEVKAQVAKFKKSESGSSGEKTFFDLNLRGAWGPNVHFAHLHLPNIYRSLSGTDMMVSIFTLLSSGCVIRWRSRFRAPPLRALSHLSMMERSGNVVTPGHVVGP